MRICAPIHSRNGLPTTAARLGAVQKIAVGNAFGGEDPGGREVPQPGLGNIFGGQGIAVLFEHPQRKEGEVEVVVLRHPVDDLAETGRCGGPVPRPALQDLVRYADGRHVLRERPLAGRLQDLADPLAGNLLHRLAQQVPGGPPEPGVRDAIGRCFEPWQLRDLGLDPYRGPRIQLRDEVTRQGA
ncbi:hypothetical protein GCM10029976_093980 [Kribbella albertanoniae]